jgi:hypothetical protein
MKKSDYKKFYLLDNRLRTLLSEQDELFWAENLQYCDWLRREQMEKKYPNPGESRKINSIYTLQVINELKVLLGEYLTDEQMALILT